MSKATSIPASKEMQETKQPARPALLPSYQFDLAGPGADVLALQAAAGNRAVSDLVQMHTANSRPPMIQAKLTINQPGDKYEQEADRIADQVMRMPDLAVQRQEVPEEEEEDKMLQMKPLAAQITPLVQREIADEEDEEVVENDEVGAIYPRGRRLSLNPRRLDVTEQERPSEPPPVHLGSVGITGLPSAPTEGRREYTGPTAVEWQPPPVTAPRLTPDDVPEPLRPGSDDAKWRRHWQDAEVARDNRPSSNQDLIKDSLKEVEKAIKPLKKTLQMLLKGATEEEGDKEDSVPRYEDKRYKQDQEHENETDLPKKDKEKKEGERVVQRQPLNEEELIAAKRADAQVPTFTSSVEAALQSVRQNGGKPLDPATRTFMEPRFGHDFGHVRVHTGPQSAEAAQTVNARAFTIGSDLVFGQGQYAPETRAGQRLLAHELAHTVQQDGDYTMRPVHGAD
jgi:hypothetical protein